MKFYPNKTLKNHQDKPILDGPTEAASVPLLLGSLAVEALIRDLPQDNNAPSNIRLHRVDLARKIEKDLVRLKNKGELLSHDEVNRVTVLSLDDIGLIKSRIFAPSAFATLVVWAANNAIEPKLEEAPEQEAKRKS